MTIRAKFRCLSVEPNADGATIKFSAVTGGSAENESFFKYTPAGDIRLAIVSPETAGKFAPGKSYFVDFTEASD